MSFDPKKSCKFLFIFFHGVENIAAKGQWWILMTNLKMNGKYTTIKTIGCSNPKTVKEVPER